MAEGGPVGSVRYSWAVGRQVCGRVASGWWSALGGRRSIYCEATAQEVFVRMCEGESLTAICEDPQMPAMTTVWKWRRDNSEFDGAIRLARECQAQRLCDRGMEIADAVTPETAYATRVRLSQLRWTAASLAPRRFGRLKSVDPEAGADGEGGGLTVIVRRFTDAPDPDLDGAVLAPGEQRLLRRG